MKENKYIIDLKSASAKKMLKQIVKKHFSKPYEFKVIERICFKDFWVENKEGWKIWIDCAFDWSNIYQIKTPDNKVFEIRNASFYSVYDIFHILLHWDSWDSFYQFGRVASFARKLRLACKKYECDVKKKKKREEAVEKAKKMNSIDKLNEKGIEKLRRYI